MQTSDADRILARVDVDETPAPSRRYRSGHTSAETYLLSRTGPLAYMVRLRQIEDLTAQHERQLGEDWKMLAVELHHDHEEFQREWRAAAAGRSFRAVNELIELHNHWYPAEARLPMDPRTGDFVSVDGRSYRRRPLDVSWVLERFPPDLTRALA